jgi:hypothetical protein
LADPKGKRCGAVVIASAAGWLRGHREGEARWVEGRQRAEIPPPDS